MKSFAKFFSLIIVVLAVLAVAVTIDTPQNSQSFGPRIKAKNGTSTNWSGYAVETNLVTPQNNAVSDVKGSWTVPLVTCTATNTYSAAWIGIDGYTDSSVEQTGTSQDCSNGKPSYYAWYEMYPKPSWRLTNFAVNPGDVISSEVQYIGNNKFVLTLNNTKTGQTFTTTQKSNGLRQSAEWIMEAPYSGGVLPLANFSSIPFTSSSATLLGTPGTINTAGPHALINMVNASGAPKATTSALTPSGDGFTVTWNAN